MARSTGLGYYQFGQRLFDEIEDIPVVIDTPNSGGRFRTQVGWGHLGQRHYDWPEEFFLRQRSAGGTSITLTITSVSGALVGKIRSDIQNCKILSLEFTNDLNGCADFILKLNTLPEFPLLPFSMLTVNIGDTTFDWYTGEISYPDQLGTQRDFYEFRGFGLRNVLKQLKADVDYAAGMDVGEIIDDLVQTWMVPYSAIKYNSSKIDTTTGVIIANDIELSKAPIDKTLQILADMSNYNWGVDGDKEFFFTAKETSLVKTIFVGYAVESFKPKLNLDKIKNAIIVQRQQGRGAGGAGWEVGGIFNDPTSVRKYGRRELQYQVPGFFSNDDVDVVGNSLISELSEPSESAEIQGFKLNAEEDFQALGLYRIILPIDEYEKDVSELDVAADWTVVNGGGDNLAVTEDTTFLVSGAASSKFTYTTAQGAYAYININLVSAIQRIRFYLKASKTGSYLTMGIGLTNWDEYTSKIHIPVQDAFILIDWDVSMFNLMNVQKFGIRVEEAGGGATLYVDRLTAKVKGYPFYEMQLSRAKYTIAPNRQAVDSEFGPIPPKMEQYIAGLFNVSQELKFTDEIR